MLIFSTSLGKKLKAAFFPFIFASHLSVNLVNVIPLYFAFSSTPENPKNTKLNVVPIIIKTINNIKPHLFFSLLSFIKVANKCHYLKVFELQALSQEATKPNK